MNDQTERGNLIAMCITHQPKGNTMSIYSINVKNDSGADANVAIYQQYPGLKGFSLVWLTQTINKDNDSNFTWPITWALNWGTTAQELAPGVKWTSKGKPQAMSPTESKGNNAMGLTFSGTQFRTEPTAFHDENVPKGSMRVTADQSFTVAQSKCMSVAVYMNGLPALAMQGRPNGVYQFDTHPTYYICTTDAEQGVAVDGYFVSSPTPIVFAAGATYLNFTLDDGLNFILK